MMGDHDGGSDPLNGVHDGGGDPEDGDHGVATSDHGGGGEDPAVSLQPSSI